LRGMWRRRGMRFIWAGRNYVCMRYRLALFQRSARRNSGAWRDDPGHVLPSRLRGADKQLDQRDSARARCRSMPNRVRIASGGGAKRRAGSQSGSAWIEARKLEKRGADKGLMKVCEL